MRSFSFKMAAFTLTSSRNVNRVLNRFIFNHNVRAFSTLKERSLAASLSRGRTVSNCTYPSLQYFCCVSHLRFQAPVSSRGIRTTNLVRDEIRTVTVPQLAESISEGDMRWDKAVGDVVAEDDVLGEVETDKTSVPIHAPAAGVIEEILVEDGATVQPGKAILKLRLAGAGPLKRNVIEMRNTHKDSFARKHGIKLGFMSAFVRAASFALQHQPIVNADGPLPNLARTGTLAIEDMDGGTFTISNGGVFGSISGTPIINPPQSAILGMHAIVDRPVAIKGKVEIRPMMNVALTYDHRLIDGREAVTFLRKVKAAVEDPRVILLDI
ncbi:dihydrolipoyllysine-residue succinyltransferase component of 2-oxoglutarate dehydrogenase complex, mitochondrial-like [Limulus polyphemus]|uniref:Dihydrolipoamide acetyltransferase component of pyruvate dehydrogenase complex n=1 Tax=Limulus polyphemus TaxID=6850 RepID=A0ABM1SPV2_LIMPO|nr:dihydrolipoyllysine-residue succinyltransferase component of 2-oxoglutarate dehydrogenase complex, mitochondrial-like [Limulus polyphemus]